MCKECEDWCVSRLGSGALLVFLALLRWPVAVRVSPSLYRAGDTLATYLQAIHCHWKEQANLLVSNTFSLFAWTWPSWPHAEMSPYFIQVITGLWLVTCPHSPPLIGWLTSPWLIHHPAAKLIMPKNICDVGTQTRRCGFEQINPQIRASCKIEYLSENLISFFTQLLSHLSPSQYSIPTSHTWHPAQCPDSVTRLNDSHSPIKILAAIIQVNNSNSMQM